MPAEELEGTLRVAFDRGNPHDTMLAGDGVAQVERRDRTRRNVGLRRGLEPRQHQLRSLRRLGKSLQKQRRQVLLAAPIVFRIAENEVDSGARHGGIEQKFLFEFRLGGGPEAHAGCLQLAARHCDEHPAAYSAGTASLPSRTRTTGSSHWRAS